MLKINNLHAYYGKSHVLHGVDFAVQPGEIVALLGRNGSGRSTTAKAIMGLVDWPGRVTGGQILFDGEDIAKADAETMSNCPGLGVVAGKDAVERHSLALVLHAIQELRTSSRHA